MITEPNREVVSSTVEGFKTLLDIALGERRFYYRLKEETRGRLGIGYTLSQNLCAPFNINLAPPNFSADNIRELGKGDLDSFVEGLVRKPSVLSIITLDYESGKALERYEDVFESMMVEGAPISYGKHLFALFVRK